jgi:hypothetical protein
MVAVAPSEFASADVYTEKVEQLHTVMSFVFSQAFEFVKCFASSKKKTPLPVGKGVCRWSLVAT